ncbi:MAG: UbiA family prenyltransferase [bacterium]|nr:UbiA family prenyltransferase [bacterium]
MIKQIVIVSRPFLWICSILAYFIMIKSTDIFSTYSFWIGLFYCSFPWNFLVMGVNDYADYEMDIVVPESRKKRPITPKEQLKLFVKLSILIQIPFFIWMIVSFSIPDTLIYFLLLALFNIVYNGFLGTKPWSSSGFPFDLLGNAFAWSLPIYICYIVNPSHFHLQWDSLLIWVLCAILFEMFSSCVDYEADQKSGKLQTAGSLGVPATVYSMVVIMLFVLLFIIIFNGYYLLGGVSLFLLALSLLKQKFILAYFSIYLPFFGLLYIIQIKYSLFI